MRNGTLLKMGRAYDERVRQTLTSRSTRGARTTEEAVKEWEYVGYIPREGTDVCQLCNHTGFRYSHKIRHKDSGDELMVGSTCCGYWDNKDPAR